VDNLWIKPVTTGVAFEPQNPLKSYPQLIHNLPEVIHRISTDLCTGYTYKPVRTGVAIEQHFFAEFQIIPAGKSQDIIR
jgi:hypothetical protein